MGETIFIGFIHNTTLLLAFAMLYENIWLKYESSKRPGPKIISGFVLGAIGIILMLTPWQLSPGMIFDTRSIMLSISGLFLGPIPTLIAICVTGIARIMIGGSGMWMGLSIIILAGTIGLLWRKYRPAWRQKNRHIELLSLGVIVHLVMLTCTFLLPAKITLPTLQTITIPLLLIFAPGTMFLGILLDNQSNNFQNRLAKEKMNEMERRLGQILTNGNIASMIINKYGYIEFCSQHLLDITGYSKEEVVGKYFYDLFIPFFLKDDIKHIFEDVINMNRDSIQQENEIIAKNGNTIFLSWNISKQLNQKDEVTGIACIGVDITDRIKYEMILNTKNEEIEEQNIEYQQINEEYNQINSELNLTNQELLEAKEKAEENDRLKSAFLANMSHEIRTPMNGILGFADLLNEPDISVEDQQVYVGVIKKSGNRMLNIINDLIDISKIEAGQTEVVTSVCNINKQIEFIYEFFKPEIENKGLSISYEFGLPTEEAEITTDREKLYAILTNLVKNAIKYTDHGKIELGYIKNSFDLLFYVKDTGIGIAKERQEAVFQRFVQADVTDQRAYAGAGLGLTISKAYVEMLGGRIWLVSEKEIGSSFYFTLPYVVERSDNKKINPAKRVRFSIKQEMKLKVLIVEDDPYSLIFLKKIVSGFCREIICAGNGEEAITICKLNSDIDLVLMDIQMPVMNGYDATKQIREFNERVVIIAQTAFALVGDRETALAAGCTDHITKPFSEKLLIELMHKYFFKN